MKAYAGIEIGPVVCVVVVSPGEGLLARSVFTLPGEDANRAAALIGALQGALRHLPDRLPECDGVGISISPPDETSLNLIASEGSVRIEYPYISGAPITFVGPEVSALFAQYGGGQGKTWITLSDRGRAYHETDEPMVDARVLEVIGERGARRRIRYAPAEEALEPIRVLRSRFGLFESLDEMRSLAALVSESAGVRIVGKKDGPAVLGLRAGIRRPHIARGALESVAAWTRQSLSELAGEGAVTELYAAGPAVSNEVLMETIADIVGATVVVSETRDAIAYGAAMRAAKNAGEEIERPHRKRYNPTMPAARREEIFTRWRVARET